MTKVPRNIAFDNIKGIMIILVVFAHLITHVFVGGTKTDLMKYLYCAVYTFHMPVFIFLSGYFSNQHVSLGDYAKKALESSFIPYLVFNIIYGSLLVAVNHKFENVVNILTPQWTLWFLLSLFFWKIMVQPFSNFNKAFCLSVALSLYSGFFDSIGTFLSLGKTLGFFPYFLAGYLFKPDYIEKIRSKKVYASVFFMVSMALVGMAISYNVTVGTLLMKVSYIKLGQCYVEGVFLRSIVLLLGFIGIWFFVAVTPGKENIVSVFGKYSLTIYLAHSGCIRILELFKVKIANPISFIVFAIVFSFLVCFLFGNKKVNDVYRGVMTYVNRVLLK